MPQPNINHLDSPLPAYRGLQRVTVGSADIVFDYPVTCRAAAAGNLDVTDSLGSNFDFDGLSAGDDIVGPGDGLLLIRAIRGSSTVTSVIVGLL